MKQAKIQPDSSSFSLFSFYLFPFVFSACFSLETVSSITSRSAVAKSHYCLILFGLPLLTLLLSPLKTLSEPEKYAVHAWTGSSKSFIPFPPTILKSYLKNPRVGHSVGNMHMHYGFFNGKKILNVFQASAQRLPA